MKTSELLVMNFYGRAGAVILRVVIQWTACYLLCTNQSGQGFTHERHSLTSLFKECMVGDIHAFLELKLEVVVEEEEGGE